MLIFNVEYNKKNGKEKKKEGKFHEYLAGKWDRYNIGCYLKPF